MQPRIGKLLVFVGAAILPLSALGTLRTWLDWGPRTCTVSGCPPQYSIGVFLSYVTHSYWVLAFDLFGLAVVLAGLKVLPNATRSRDCVLPILAGLAVGYVVTMIFSAPYYTPTVTSISTVTRTTTRG